MSRRYGLMALVLILALPAVAARLDIQTGEPIPYPAAEVPAAIPAPPIAEFTGDLELVYHIAEGASKNVRALPGNVVVWQNGAWFEAHDLTNPAAPVALSRVLLPAQPSDLKVVGSTVYLALRKNFGLWILDYSDPASPVQLGALDGYDLLSVEVSGTLAYCGRGTPGFIVVDIANPAAPAVIGQYDTPGSANGTSVEGTVLAVALGASGVGFYNVADPTSPTEFATFATNGFCTFVLFRNGLAYAADAQGLRIVDGSNPAAPALVGQFTGAGGSCYELTFTADPDLVYLAGLGGLFALNVANPAAPFVAGSAAVGNSFSCASGPGFVVSAARFTGLHILSTNLDQVALLQNAGFAMKVAFDGNTLHVADLAGGVRLWNVTVPSAPALLAKVATDPNCQNLAVTGGRLYAVNSNNTGAGLVIADVSNPAAPVTLSTYDTGAGTMDVDVGGSLAVLANGFGGLRTVDVGNPAAPMLLGDLPLGANTFGVALQANVAFVATFGGGMFAVDVADPAAMTILDTEAWGFLNALDVHDGYAWVADGQAGLRIVDISDPANLVSVATLATASQARDAVRSRAFSPFVYVADDFYGLRQIDVADPTSPLLFGSYPTADRGLGVAVQGPYVAVASGETGVYIFRNPSVVPAMAGSLDATVTGHIVTLDLVASVPTQSGLTITRTTADPAESRVFAAHELQVQPDGGRALLRDADRVSFPRTYRLEFTLEDGAKIELASITVTPTLPQHPQLAAAPNPFNPRLEVSYVMPQAQAARIDVLDARGRLVRTLLQGTLPAGPGTIVWDGQDATGRDAASGVYLVRLRAADQVTTRSVTLVR